MTTTTSPEAIAALLRCAPERTWWSRRATDEYIDSLCHTIAALATERSELLALLKEGEKK